MARVFAVRGPDFLRREVVANDFQVEHGALVFLAYRHTDNPLRSEGMEEVCIECYAPSRWYSVHEEEAGGTHD